MEISSFFHSSQQQQVTVVVQDCRSDQKCYKCAVEMKMRAELKDGCVVPARAPEAGGGDWEGPIRLFGVVTGVIPS